MGVPWIMTATAALGEAKAQAAEASMTDLTGLIDFHNRSRGVTNLSILA